jgi:hypothetical protein
MRRLFTSPHLTEVSMLKDLLDRAGIRNAITDGSGALCADGLAVFGAELWVDNVDYIKALEVKRDFLGAANS